MGWLSSLTKVGRRDRIIDGLNAQISEIQTATRREIASLNERLESQREKLPSSILEKAHKELDSGNVKIYSDLILDRSTDDSSLGNLLFERARILASLLPNEKNWGRLEEAQKVSTAAEYFSQSDRAAGLARGLNALDPKLDQNFHVTLDEEYAASGSDPDVAAGWCVEASKPMLNTGFRTLAMSFMRRAYLINRKGPMSKQRMASTLGYLSALAVDEDMEETLQICSLERKNASNMPSAKDEFTYRNALQGFELFGLFLQSGDPDIYDTMKEPIEKLKRTDFFDGQITNVLRMQRLKVGQKIGINMLDDAKEIDQDLMSKYGETDKMRLTAHF